jgi:N-acetylglucosamine kinase-like BadF-type ATPase
MKCVLGFDGGGTKTECAVMDLSGAILARAVGPPSNPTRIGFPVALDGMVQASDLAIRSLPPPVEIVALCAGLAGTGSGENRGRMRDLLSSRFSGALIELRTDLEIPLSAMPVGPAMALIVGTGSAAIGRDEAGTIRREGGLGPATSDEGSAFAIGRAAVGSSRGEDSDQAVQLSRQIRVQLGLANWRDLDAKAASQPDSVYPRIFPVVASAADAGNLLAQSLLHSAAADLAALALRLAQALKLRDQDFPLGKTGGAVGRSSFFDAALDRALQAALPGARIAVLQIDPAALAARIALGSLLSREQTPQ